jgi:Putative MetA-pathway of phenol degradation
MKKYFSAFNCMYLKIFALTALVVMLTCPNAAQAQGDGARFYWKGLKGTNAVPLITSSLGGNANPLDPSQTVIPGSNFSALMSMVGYARMIAVGDRSAFISVIQPLGRVTSELTFNGRTFINTARGYGDPMVEFDINIIGPKAIKNIPDMIRYSPRFSMDIAANLAFPIGEYDNTTPINIGQNRWYGRIGTPMILQIGPWVPGKRTTLEFLPAIWLYGANNDFVGEKMTTEPMFQLEGHLTRDFMEKMWGSLDVISHSGGKATIGGVEGNSLSNIGVGASLGYKITDNIQAIASYSSTVNDKNPEDLKIDGFRLVVMCGWHSLVEGMGRLKKSGH